MMEIGYSYNFYSGLERRKAYAIGYRFDQDIGFRPDAGESHVLEFAENNQVHGRFWKVGWFTGLWASPTGIAFITDSEGHLHRLTPKAQGKPSRSFPVSGLPVGVWGLDESNVFVWGQRGGVGTMYHFDGTELREMPAPPGKVIAVHGTRSDLIVAVGEDGLIARWDGSEWHVFPKVSDALLSSVFVVDEDEMYASGKGKQILDGSVHGWSLRYEHPSPLGAIAKWQGRIWVASGGDFGLSELVDDQLVSKKPNLLSTVLDARGELLISCPGLVAGTADGSKFTGVRTDALERITASTKPAW